MYLLYHSACLFLVRVDTLSESVKICPLSLACTGDLHLLLLEFHCPHVHYNLHQKKKLGQ